MAKRARVHLRRQETVGDVPDWTELDWAFGCGTGHAPKQLPDGRWSIKMSQKGKKKRRRPRSDAR